MNAPSKAAISIAFALLLFLSGCTGILEKPASGRSEGIFGAAIQQQDGDGAEQPGEEGQAAEGIYEAVIYDDFESGAAAYRYFLRTDAGLVPLEFAGEPLQILSGSRIRILGFEREGGIMVPDRPGAIQILEERQPPQRSPLADVTAKKVALILFNFQNDNGQPQSDVEASRQAYFTDPESVSAFWLENSYGSLSLEGKLGADGEAFGLYTIPYANSQCSLNTIFSAWIPAAHDAAVASGSDLSGYDYLVYASPETNCGGIGGAAYLGGPEAWINGAAPQDWHGVSRHETGHLLGMLHAHSIDCLSEGARVPIALPLPDRCTIQDYGDIFDVMGYGSSKHTSNVHKHMLDWFEPANVLTVNSSGNYTLYPNAIDTEGVQALKIPYERNGAGETTSYLYLEYRRPFGFDSFDSANPVVNGVTMRLATGAGVWSVYLVDAVPQTPTFLDAPLVQGGSFNEGDYGIHVQTISASPDYATVEIIVLGQRPSVTSASLAPSGFTNEQDSSFSGSATDADGNLESLEVWQRFEGGSWETIAATNCPDSPCLLNAPVSRDYGYGYYDYQLIALDSNGLEAQSGLLQVYYQLPSANRPPSVDYFDMDRAPSTNYMGDVASLGVSDPDLNIDYMSLRYRFNAGQWIVAYSQRPSGTDPFGDPCTSASCFEFVQVSRPFGYGIYEYQALVNDTYGLLDESPVISVNYSALPEISPTAPSISLTPSGNTGEQTSAISGSSSDPNSNLASLSLMEQYNGGSWQAIAAQQCSGGGCEISAQISRGRGYGSYLYQIVAADTAGRSNASSIAYANYFADFSPQAPSIIYFNVNPNGTTNLTYWNLSGAVVDPNSDITMIRRYKLNPDGSTQYWPVALNCTGALCTIYLPGTGPLEIGHYEYWLYARDSALMDATSPHVSVDYIPSGETNPEPIIYAFGVDPSGSTHQASSAVGGAASDPNTDLSSIELRELFEGNWQTLLTATSYLGRPAALSTVVNRLLPGLYTYRFVATDAAGGISTADISVDYALPPPNAVPSIEAFDVQPNGLTDSATSQVSATASDADSNLASLSLDVSFNGGEFSSLFTQPCAGASCSLEYTATRDSIGIYEYRLIAMDGAGSNAADSATVDYQPADSPPSIASFDVQPSGFTRQEKSLATASATDEDSNLASLELQQSIDGGESESVNVERWESLFIQPCTGSACSLSYTAARSADGVYQYRVIAADSAGLLAQSKAIEVAYRAISSAGQNASGMGEFGIRQKERSLSIMDALALTFQNIWELLFGK